MQNLTQLHIDDNRASCQITSGILQKRHVYSCTQSLHLSSKRYDLMERECSIRCNHQLSPHSVVFIEYSPVN